MTNLQAAKHFNVQLTIATENDMIVPREYIQDVYNRFTTAYSALITELMSEGLNASEAAQKAKDLISE